MSNTKSDKPLVLKLIAGCVIAILIFTFSWAKQFFANLDLWYFTLIEGGLLAVFIVEAIGSYHYADDPDKDWKRHFVWILALACCAWAAGWSCGVNGKNMMDDDIKKAKETSFIKRQQELFHIMTKEEIFVSDIVYLNESAVVYDMNGKAHNQLEYGKIIRF